MSYIFPGRASGFIRDLKDVYCEFSASQIEEMDWLSCLLDVQINYILAITLSIHESYLLERVTEQPEVPQALSAPHFPPCLAEKGRPLQKASTLQPSTRYVLTWMISTYVTSVIRDTVEPYLSYFIFTVLAC